MLSAVMTANVGTVTNRGSTIRLVVWSASGEDIDQLDSINRKLETQ
jgi:hypothetical protein